MYIHTHKSATTDAALAQERRAIASKVTEGLLNGAIKVSPDSVLAQKLVRARKALNKEVYKYICLYIFLYKYLYLYIS